MQIFNSLTRKKEKFEPINKDIVGMYVCGPTVYDLPHIGHVRAAYIFETIRSYFEYKGWKVQFVRNITDVDDKIIAKAREEFPDVEINQAVSQVADKYTRSYLEDLRILGIRPADEQPRATAHIEQMKEYISRLLEGEFAYQISGDVYFDVRKFKDYGRLSHQDLEQIRSHVRIEKDEKKRDPLDFALWKKAKPDEPSWLSPWGRGRPGWHIECSVMSSKYLGETFDIHGGGIDLIFPHHENERAQSCAASGADFARFWIHNGLLTINGQKMAKSLGNFVSLQDFLAAGYQVDVLKLFFLHTHYSQPVDFSWEKMEEKKQALDRIKRFLERVERREKETDSHLQPDVGRNLRPDSPKGLRKKVERAGYEFEQFMDDDFNTPGAIAVLFEIVWMCNAIGEAGFTEEYFPVLKYAKGTIEKLAGIFAISFQPYRPFKTNEEQEEIERLINMRNDLRMRKKFTQADQIREKLLKEKNVELEDTKEGTAWRVKS